MNTSELHNKIADSYLHLMQNLSVDAKLDLIAKLSLSLKTTNTNKHSIEYYCGSWQTEDTAEEIIDNMRQSRTFNRKIETR